MKIKIREIAQKRGYSLYKLSQYMKLPQQTVYSWASGRTQPSYKNMEYLCAVLECDLGELFEVEQVQLKESECNILKSKALKAYKEYKRALNTTRKGDPCTLK